MPATTHLLGDAGPLLRALDPELHRTDAGPDDAARLAGLRRAVDVRRTDAGRPARDPRRRLLLAGVPAALVATAAVVAVAVSGGGPVTEPGRPITGVVAVQAGSPAGAAELLDRIALAASSQPVVVPRTDQFVYVKSEIAFTRPLQERTFDGPGVLDEVHGREVWLSQDPARRDGLIREDGDDVDLIQGAGDPTLYALLAELPTDPAQLLAEMQRRSAGDAGGTAYAAFDQIGELLRETIAPPGISAALYRAAALIPGVEVVPDAVDAADRHGIGVALVHDGERSEWVFDPTTYAYLGQRSYLVQDTTLGPAGMLTGLSAVLARGVTDGAGDQPDADQLVD
jgi:hypothetical protein